EGDDLGALRLVAQHRDLPRARAYGIRERPGRFVGNDLQGHGQPARELTRELDGHPALLAVGAERREELVLEVDAGAELAGGRQLGAGGGGNGSGVGHTLSSCKENSNLGGLGVSAVRFYLYPLRSSRLR